MKEEISAAVLFVSKLAGASLTGDVMASFERRLAQLLEERFSDHWHPERPWQGQAYRCLRVNANSRKEPTIERAARDCGLKYKDLNLPVELTVWVDPEEVCCRFGEQKGSCCTVASFREGNKENFIETFDFSRVERPSTRSQSSEVLREKATGPSNVPSAPSSAQSTPTRRKPHAPGTKGQTSPGRSPNVRERRPLGAHHPHGGPAPLPPPRRNGSYSPPLLRRPVLGQPGPDAAPSPAPPAPPGLRGLRLPPDAPPLRPPPPPRPGGPQLRQVPPQVRVERRGIPQERQTPVAGAQGAGQGVDVPRGGGGTRGVLRHGRRSGVPTLLLKSSKDDERGPRPPFDLLSLSRGTCGFRSPPQIRSFILS